MAAVYTVIVLIGIVFTTIRARIMAFVSQEIVYDIREDLFAHLQKLPFSYYDSRPAGRKLWRNIMKIPTWDRSARHVRPYSNRSV